MVMEFTMERQNLCNLIISVCICTTVLSVVDAKIGFIKDQSMDAVFPGPVYKQAPSLPEGHMRPLGWQRRPDGPIAEDEMPATREFFEKYVSQDKPVVFRSAVSDAPAFVTWQEDNYLTEKYGEMNVTVRVRIARRKDKVESTVQVMKVKKFLYDYMYDEWYLASVLPDAMKEELPLPKCVRCGSISERLMSAQMWMSSGGTSSRVHSHDDHLLHCVLFGRRDFILVENMHKKAFDFQEDYPGSLGGHSDINTEMVNAFIHKSIARVPWTWASLYPGDCVFVPAGYLHHVRSYGRSISITIEFAPLHEFDDTGCTLIEEDFVPLSQASYLLSFEEGRLRLTKRNLDAEGIRRILLLLAGKTGRLSMGKFEHLYTELFGEDPDIPKGRRVFELMVSDEEETQLIRKDIIGMKDEVLQKVAQAINSANSVTETKYKEKMEDSGRTSEGASFRVSHEEL